MSIAWSLCTQLAKTWRLNHGRGIYRTSPRKLSSVGPLHAITHPMRLCRVHIWSGQRIVITSHPPGPCKSSPPPPGGANVCTYFRFLFQSKHILVDSFICSNKFIIEVKQIIFIWDYIENVLFVIEKLSIFCFMKAYRQTQQETRVLSVM